MPSAQLAIATADAQLPAAPRLLPLETYCRVFERYSVGAVRKKISRQDWAEGREYHRAPDGSIWINIAGVERWVLGESSKISKSIPVRSASVSGLTASCTERL
jgi:hypothetical protein